MHAPSCKKQENLHKKTILTKALFKSIITKNKLLKRYITSSNKNEDSEYKNYCNKLNHIM